MSSEGAWRGVRSVAPLKASVGKTQVQGSKGSQGSEGCEAKGVRRSQTMHEPETHIWWPQNLCSLSGTYSHSHAIQTIGTHPIVFSVHPLVCMYACKNYLFLTYVYHDRGSFLFFTLFFTLHSAFKPINIATCMSHPLLLDTAWYSSHHEVHFKYFICTLC